MKRIAPIVAILLGFAAIIATARIGVTRYVWLTSAFVNPQWGGHRELPPFPTPEWNPFALNESGIGGLICGLVAREANRAEHLGASQKTGVPFATPTGLWLYRLRRAMEPSIHVHASDGVGVRVARSDYGDEVEEAEDHHIDDHHDHDDDNHHHEEHERANPNVAELQFARSSRDDLIEWGYLLDPTNLTALSVFKGAVAESGIGDGQMREVEAFGMTKEIPRARYRVIQLCRYSLARYQIDSGYWPEQCLYAAKAFQFVWLAFEGGSDDYSKETKEERTARLTHMGMLADEIEKLLALADGQRRTLEQVGLWQLRSPEAIRHYRLLHAQLDAVVNLLRERLASENNEA